MPIDAKLCYLGHSALSETSPLCADSRASMSQQSHGCLARSQKLNFFHSPQPLELPSFAPLHLTYDMHVCICIYAHTYIHTYIHAYIHLYIYIYSYKHVRTITILAHVCFIYVEPLRNPPDSTEALLLPNSPKTENSRPGRGRHKPSPTRTATKRPGNLGLGFRVLRSRRPGRVTARLLSMLHFKEV